ncbi:MAG: hypothetical protein U0350_27440 [Caldilineaceae bacterium]
MTEQQFAIEPLENRLEQLRCYWYVGLCIKWIWFIPILYPCWKIACYL